ncbi:MAG TPA: low affinity iron permease family protein [Planctomycetota bacterium]|nr:low affinity iron permease family protein [Planctomycetota bacterium]
MKKRVESKLQPHPGNTPLALVNRILERFAHAVSVWVGGNWAFAIACFLVIAWVFTGPLFGYSDTWQLAINTSTTIVTFLMVFLIQRAQNKESRATQLKLNELVAALEGASNRLIGVENLSEEELEVLERHYQVLIDRVKRDVQLTQSHSIDEAERRHVAKHEKERVTRPPAKRT